MIYGSLTVCSVCTKKQENNNKKCKKCNFYIKGREANVQSYIAQGALQAQTFRELLVSRESSFYLCYYLFLWMEISMLGDCVLDEMG